MGKGTLIRLPAPASLGQCWRGIHAIRREDSTHIAPRSTARHKDPFTQIIILSFSFSYRGVVDVVVHAGAVISVTLD